MGVAIGDCRPKRNKALAAWVKSMYQKLLIQRKGNVKWSHVKGHSSHKWNDVVDELAMKGADQGPFGGQVTGNAWARTRLDGELQPVRTRIGVQAQLEIKLTKQRDGWLVTEKLKPVLEYTHPIRMKNTWIVQAASKRPPTT